ncbi:MAG: ATP-binding protein [Acidimicrobiia bacterium]
MPIGRYAITTNAGLGERRVVTALFADIVGSTSIAESMDPEDWTDLLNRIVAGMAAAVERYDGTVTHFGGDSILALFGAPHAHEDDPYRAVRAGLDIVEATTALAAEVRQDTDVEIAVRVGVNTGLVVVGDVAAGGLSTYTAIGDATNVAARIQGEANPGTLLISSDTYDLIASDVQATPLPPVEIKGKAEPIRVYEVTSVATTNTRRRGVPGLHSPMVGRDEEFTSITHLLDVARAGRGRVAAIVGEPGVGKSRMITELSDAIEAMDGARLAVGRCASFDEVRPFHLMASLVCAMAGVSISDDPAVVQQAVAGLCGDSENPTDATVLLQMIGVAEGTTDDASAQADAYADAFGRAMGLTAMANQPLVLVVEDAHWADASSAQVLAAQLKRLATMPVLGVLVTRPDRSSYGWTILEEARRELGESLTEITLAPLDMEDSRTLVSHLLAIESLPADLRTMILDKAEGNPFFLEEVVRMLVDRDLIFEHDGRWIARDEIADLEVPGTLQSLLASRIDALDANTRAVAMVASVIGRDSDTDLLLDVLGGDNYRGGMLAAIEDLESHGVMKLVATAPRISYRFRHALLHDVVYESILRRRRRELHHDVARSIERLYPDRLGDLAPVLARHFREAGDRSKALAYTTAAADASMARHATHEAYRFYLGALELAEGADGSVSPRDRLELEIGAVRASIRFTPGAESLETLDALRQSAEELGDVNLLGRVFGLILVIRTMGSEWYGDDAFREVMDRAYALAPSISDPGLSATLTGLMGQVLRTQDEFEQAAALMGGAVDPLEQAGLTTDAAMNAILTADVLGQRGDFTSAHDWIERATQLAERSGNPTAIADANLIRGRLLATEGKVEEALVHTQRGMDLAADAENLYCELVGNFLVADQQLRLGDAKSAIPHLEKSFELGEYCNAAGFMMLGRAWIASARAQLGDLDPEGYTQSLNEAIGAGSRSGEAAVRLHRAIVTSGMGDADWEAAFADFERSIALLDDIEARPDQARAMHAYAMALDSAGRPEGVTKLAEAAELFDQLGMTVDTQAG